MARSGSFGGSLNPFGSGSGGSFGAYDIASNLAELEVYRVEVAWGNGTATDDDYLAALRKALEATLPDTRDRESAQNRLDDAVYRIGRSKVADDLDALIAFDQAALAKMNPNNLKYRSVEDSLKSELAARRSRDYGDLVLRYNKGEISTETLKEWVDAQLRTVDDDDPDYDNWVGAQQDLEDRVKSEKDEKVYQDYQQRRMTPAAFLTYLRGRQAEFDPESPQYDDWSRRVEDAEKQIKADRLAKQDTAFFNSYQEGKKSDKQYLAYLRKRIDGMDDDDPDLPEWKHRLNQASYSLAEDQLRWKVETGKEPVGKLIRFYKNYQKTLKPGSQEWRTVARALRSLGSSGGGGGGGGGGGSRSSGGGSSGGGLGKAIDKANNTDEQTRAPKAIQALGPDVWGAIVASGVDFGKGTKTRDYQKEVLDRNIQAAKDAHDRQDDRWLWVDPKHPDKKIPEIGPDGKPTGQMVYGSKYLPATADVVTEFMGIEVAYEYSYAAQKRGEGDYASWQRHLGYAESKERALRDVRVRDIGDTNLRAYKEAEDAIDMALRHGDLRTAFNIAAGLQENVRADLAANPYLDDTRRDRLNQIIDKVDNYPEFGTFDETTGKQIGGALDWTRSTFDRDGNLTTPELADGWHFQLDRTKKDGSPDWGYVYRDPLEDANSGKQYVTVHANDGYTVVTGEVEVRSSGAPLNITVKTADGQRTVPFAGATQYIQYKTFNGETVKAYTLDGSTWLRSTSGTLPQLEFDGVLQEYTDDKGDTYLVDPSITDDAGAPARAMKLGSDGWTWNPAYEGTAAGKVGFYGKKDFEKRAKERDRIKTRDKSGKLIQGQFVSKEEERYGFMAGRGTVRSTTGLTSTKGGVYVGAPGQAMQVVTTSPSGAINLTGQRGGGKDESDDRRWVSQERAWGRSGAPTSMGAGVMEHRVTMRAGRGSQAAPSFGQRINAQLPADTPSRYDGIGLVTTYTLPGATPTIAKWAPTSSVSTSPRLTTKNAFPPPVKKTARTPIKTPGSQRGLKNPEAPKPRAKPKPKPIRMGTGARTGTITSNVNRAV